MYIRGHFLGAQTKLTFEHGQFVLRNPPQYPGENWELGAFREKHVTTNLKAAAVWRRYGSEIAKRVISTAFNKLHDCPDLPPLPLLGFLDPHQIQGIKWILSRKRTYLAHAPGAGKTVQAIVASVLAGPGQTLFIVPPSLTENWVREIYRFTEWAELWPTVSVVGTGKQNQGLRFWKADFIIVPDSMLAKRQVYDRLRELDIKFLAVDEASRFKEVAAIRSSALYGGKRGGTDGGYKYCGLIQRPKHVVFLDGSPLLNRPMELWGPVTALDPEAINCMSMHEFGVRYCGAKTNERGQWEYKYSTNELELRVRLRQRLMHVVTEEELNHPERRRSMLFMNQEVRTPEFRKWERANIEKIKITDIDGATHLSGNEKGELAERRKELGVAKVPWISSYINDKLQSTNESILLFVWHREVAIELEKRLVKWHPGLVIGGTSNVYREVLFREFQDGRRRLIIGNIAAMGRGHNLQRADRVVFGEYSWTDESNKQCEKRASRRGRDAAAYVRCEYVVLPSSMDEFILNAIFTKAERVKRVIG